MKLRPTATLRAHTGSIEGCFEPELSRMRAAHRNDYKPLGEKFLTDYVAHRAREIAIARKTSERVEGTRKRNWLARQNSVNDCAAAAIYDRRPANPAVRDRRYKSA